MTMRTIVKRIRKCDSELVRSLFMRSEQPFLIASDGFFNDTKNYLLVAFRKNVPCGFLYAYLLYALNSIQPKMFLYSIDVFDNHKRTGVGSLLLHHLKRITMAKGCSEIFVLTNRSNISAMKFFDETGAVRENKDDVMFVYHSKPRTRRRNGI